MCGIRVFTSIFERVTTSALCNVLYMREGVRGLFSHSLFLKTRRSAVGSLFFFISSSARGTYSRATAFRAEEFATMTISFPNRP